MKIPKLSDFDLETTATKNCSLIFGMVGTKEAIRENLLLMLSQMDSPYGKPLQGGMYRFSGELKVSTPVWGGEDY